MNDFIIVYNDELCHHGIKGMKWGVRRYQKYPGSYTQRGVKRFNESLSEYERHDKRYKDAKKNAKEAKEAKEKAKVTNARLARTKAKKRLNNDYDRLKKDKLADKGKELYSKGKTIRGSAKVTSALAAIGGASIYLSENKLLKSNRRISIPVGKNKYRAVKPSNVLKGIGATLIATSVAKTACDSNKNKKLRAYYNHSSKR